MSTLDDSNRAAQPRAHILGLRPRVLAGLLVGGLALAGAGIAFAQTMPGHGHWRHGPHLGMVQKIALMALDSVGANSVQEAKIHDIIATTFMEVQAKPEDREAMRKQMLDLLRAPTLDPAAIEAMRAEQVAKFDTKSKAIVKAIEDAAGQLTPAQRVALADRADAMMQHGPMDGHWGPGDRHGEGHMGPRGDGPDGDRPASSDGHDGDEPSKD